MAFTVTDFAGSYAEVGPGTSLSSGAFTPTSGSVMICWVRHVGEADISTISGHGVTWTKIGHVDSTSSSQRIELYWASGHAAASDTVDLTFTSQNCHMGVFEIEGADTSSPDVQFDVDGGSYVSPPPGTISITWTSGFTTGNLAIGAYWVSNAGGALNPEGGATELFEDPAAWGGRLAIHYLEDDGSPSCGMTDAHANIMGIAVEIAAAAGAPTLVIPGITQRNIRHSGRYM